MLKDTPDANAGQLDVDVEALEAELQRFETEHATTKPPTKPPTLRRPIPALRSALEQIQRNFVTEAEGLAAGVLETVSPGDPADAGLRVLAQELFVDSGRILLELEAGAPHQPELGARLRKALEALHGAHSTSNLARELREVISGVAASDLVGDLEQVEARGDPAQIRMWEQTIEQSVEANASRALTDRLARLRDGSLLLDAVRACKTRPYQKKPLQFEAAMKALLRALDISSSTRSMQGKPRT